MSAPAEHPGPRGRARLEVINRAQRVVSRMQRGDLPTTGVRLMFNRWGWAVVAWWPTPRPGRITDHIEVHIRPWRWRQSDGRLVDRTQTIPYYGPRR